MTTPQSSSAPLVFIGTFTTRLPHVDGKAEGVYVYRLDMNTGGLHHVSTLQGQANPAYLAIHPDGRTLLIANEVDAGETTACRLDPQSGQLMVLNTQPAQGKHPCHITIHDNGKFAIVANYTSGNLVVYPLQNDGRLAAASTMIQHEGSSVNASRQEAAHAHCTLIDSESNRVFVADLGMDKVMIYDLDTQDGTLSPANTPFITLQAGAGPRHLALHPDGKWLFVINELDSTIGVFSYDRASGALAIRQTISTLPPDFSGNSTTAAIHIHPSGQFVYGSNRGHDSIAIFRFDAGTLTAAGHVPTKGRSPRDFGIDPGGRFLLAANQDTDTIATYRIDPESGTLTDTGQVAAVPTPVCVKMLAVR